MFNFLIVLDMLRHCLGESRSEKNILRCGFQFYRPRYMILRVEVFSSASKALTYPPTFESFHNVGQECGGFVWEETQGSIEIGVDQMIYTAYRHECDFVHFSQLGGLQIDVPAVVFCFCFSRRAVTFAATFHTS